MGWKGNLGAALKGFNQGFRPFLQMKLQERELANRIVSEFNLDTDKKIASGELVPTNSIPMSKPDYQYNTMLDTQFNPAATLPGLQGVKLTPTTGQETGTVEFKGRQYSPKKPEVKYGETKETWQEKQTFETNEKIRQPQERAKLKTEKPIKFTDTAKEAILKKVYLGQPLNKGEQQIYNDIIKKGSLLEGLLSGGLGGGEFNATPSGTESQYNIGDIISQGGMKYKVVGFDTDGEPLVEPVRQ